MYQSVVYLIKPFFVLVDTSQTLGPEEDGGVDMMSVSSGKIARFDGFTQIGLRAR